MIEKFKVLRTLLLLLSTASFTGCFEQDYSFCPLVENVELDFRLIGEDDFTRHVTSVDAYIYDATGNYIRTERLEEHHLDEFEGMRVALPPGNYRMVFWANMNGNTEVDGHENGAGHISVPDSRYDEDGIVTTNGDQLWYGPSVAPTRATRGTPQEHYELTAPVTGEYSDVIFFTHAHRSLEIYVKGLAELPTVDVEGLPAGMEHKGMEVTGETVNASLGTSLVDKEGTSYAAATFDTFYFEETDGIRIVIRNSGGAELYRVSLADAIAGSGADPDGRVIPLVITFFDGSVEVTMPGWSTSNPGFEI